MYENQVLVGAMRVHVVTNALVHGHVLPSIPEFPVVRVKWRAVEGYCLRGDLPCSGCQDKIATGCRGYRHATIFQRGQCDIAHHQVRCTIRACPGTMPCSRCGCVVVAGTRESVGFTKEWLPTCTEEFWHPLLLLWPTRMCFPCWAEHVFRGNSQ